MPQFLIDHLDGCTPLNPCASCEALTFLKRAMKPADYEKFHKLLAKGAGVEVHVKNLPPIDLEKPWHEVFPRIPVRLANVFKNDNLVSVADLLKLSRRQILRMPNVSRKTLREFEIALSDYGLALAENSD